MTFGRFYNCLIGNPKEDLIDLKCGPNAYLFMSLLQRTLQDRDYYRPFCR